MGNLSKVNFRLEEAVSQFMRLRDLFFKIYMFELHFVIAFQLQSVQAAVCHVSPGAKIVSSKASVISSRPRYTRSHSSGLKLSQWTFKENAKTSIPTGNHSTCTDLSETVSFFLKSNCVHQLLTATCGQNYVNFPAKLPVTEEK